MNKHRYMFHLGFFLSARWPPSAWASGSTVCHPEWLFREGFLKKKTTLKTWLKENRRSSQKCHWQRRRHRPRCGFFHVPGTPPLLLLGCCSSSSWTWCVCTPGWEKECSIVPNHCGTICAHLAQGVRYLHLLSVSSTGVPKTSSFAWKQPLGHVINSESDNNCRKLLAMGFQQSSVFSPNFHMMESSFRLSRVLS